MGVRGYSSALPILIKKQEKELMFKVYITDALKYIGALNIRYIDMIDDSPVDTRTPEEVIDGIRDKLGRLQEENNDGFI